jgi:trk system potassium uptake protein TrkA
MKFCIIGLGRFGYQVATGLADNGMEVLALDSNEAIVATIRDQVTQAICMNVEDEESLRSIGVEEMDTVIVAMGENFAQSILVTALLKKRLKIPKVIARAVNDIHKEILTLIGADLIILPEKEIGIRLADSLSSPFIEQVRLTEDFCISKITAPRSFIDKKIDELDLYTKYASYCIGIQKGDVITSVATNYVIQQHDKLVITGSNKQLERIAQLP